VGASGKRGRRAKAGHTVGGKRGYTECVRQTVDYVAALALYIAEAERSCDIFWRTRGDRASPSEHVGLIAQLDRENDAGREYKRARKKLLRSSGINELSFSKRSERTGNYLSVREQQKLP
jgi:hypothetical protein